MMVSLGATWTMRASPRTGPSRSLWNVSRIATAALLGAPLPRRIASRPVDWMVVTICEGAAGGVSSGAKEWVGGGTGASNGDELGGEVGAHVGDAWGEVLMWNVRA